jgi:hypothetical protein
MLMSSEEKEKPRRRYEPISTVFDEKCSTFGAEKKNVAEKFTKFDSKEKSVFEMKSKNFVDNKPVETSIMPTSSQLVKNVEESFKTATKEQEDTVDGRWTPRKV